MEADLWIRAFLALILVGGLIGIVAILAKKFMPGHIIARHHKDKRVTIIETTYIDPKNKLLLIQRDETQHLILVGQQNLVLETHISDKKKGKAA